MGRCSSVGGESNKNPLEKPKAKKKRCHMVQGPWGCFRLVIPTGKNPKVGMWFGG